MIVFSNQSLKETTREEIYALRRILVGRLQRSSRGVPRRGSASSGLRQFAEEWTSFLEGGRLPLLRRRAGLGPAVRFSSVRIGRGESLLSRPRFSGRLDPSPATGACSSAEAESALVAGSGPPSARERAGRSG